MFFQVPVWPNAPAYGAGDSGFESQYGLLFLFFFLTKKKKSGGAGYRSLCLMHAKHALYHLSYTPAMDKNNDVAEI